MVKYFVRETKLLSSTKNGHKSVSFMKKSFAILCKIHGKAVKTDRETKVNFIKYFKWWPEMYQDIQKNGIVAVNTRNPSLFRHISGRRFELYFIYFAWQLRMNNIGKNYSI